MQLGQGWALEPREEEQPLVLNPLDEVLIAISLLRETLTSLPAPVVHVEPQDLSAVVQAVQGLAGPTSQLTAQDIARAVQEVLLPAPVTESTPEWVERLLEALERIDFRMKATGVVSGGGSSSVTVQNQPGTTLAVTGDFAQRQVYDTANSTTRTSANGATQYVGAWTATRSIGVQRCLVILASTVASGLGGTFEFQFSEDGVTPTVDETRTITSFSSVRDFDLENVGAYFRVKFTPSRALTGAEQIFITTQYATQDPGRFVRLANQQVELQNAALPQNLTFLQGFDENGLSQNIQALLASDSIDATDYGILVKSINVGRQPDGDYVNAKATGTVFETSTPLGSSATYTSAWFDSDGWDSIELVVKTNVVSASDGVVIEYTNDVQAGTPTVIHQIYRTFNASDVSVGSQIYRFAPAGDGFRIKYTNGGTAQGSFYMGAVIHDDLVELPQSGFESSLGVTSKAVMTRGLIAAVNDAGVYDNIKRSTTTGALRVSLAETETTVKVKPDTSITGSAGSVTATPSKIIDITTVPAGATSVQIQAQKGNNQVLLFATSSGNATSSNAFFELDAGQSQFISIGTGLTTDIWCASASGTQGYRINWTAGGAS